MRNSKVGNLDSTYSICFSQVLLKLFTFLINTAIKRYTACSSPRHLVTEISLIIGLNSGSKF